MIGGGSNDDMVSVWRAVVEAISELRTAINTIFGVATTTGLFTMTATATLDVLAPEVVAGSIIMLQPVDAAAATLQQTTEALYVDRANTVAGTSFRVATADGGSPPGGEVFAYVVFNPLS